MAGSSSLYQIEWISLYVSHTGPKGRGGTKVSLLYTFNQGPISGLRDILARGLLAGFGRKRKPGPPKKFKKGNWILVMKPVTPTSEFL